MIFGNAAPAIDALVKCFRPAAGEIGDDEAGIGSLWSYFDARDDTLDAAPARVQIIQTFAGVPQSNSVQSVPR